MSIKREIFYVVIGPPRVATSQKFADDAVGVFDSIELAADFARALATFQVYQSKIDSFAGAELIVRSDASGSLAWPGSSSPSGNLARLFAGELEEEARQEIEADISDEEHLDWQV